MAPAALAGTIQNDVLKEYIARGNYIFPARPSMRLTVDTFRYCTERLPRFNTISISGYHIREAGLDRRPGARVHARQRHRLRAGGGRRRARGGRVRAPALVLLQRPQRLLPGGGEVPGGADAVGRGHARPLRRPRRAQPDAALPRPDGRLDADRAAGREQHRARGGAGVLGRLRRRPRACTRTPSTRRSRCRPSAARRSRFAPSRSSPPRRARPTPPTRWPAATTSRRSPTPWPTRRAS